ncbi:MAG: serine hydrolase [Rhodothermales bacterium]
MTSIASRCRLAGLLLALLAGPRFAAAQPAIQAADALIDQYAAAGQFQGVALVAQGDSILLEKGVGEANRDWGIPNGRETRFRVGSITKQFTAAIILQFVEDGRIVLNAPIRAYLPDYPLPQGNLVTIHHLLTHTSGIPNYTDNPDFVRIMRDPYAPDSFYQIFAGLPLEYEPGSRYSYSNSGYFLLGVLIEHVAGQPFERVLQTRLLNPLGLHDTGYDRYDTLNPHRATGYVRSFGQYVPAPYIDTSIPFAAGMMYATARDLHRWTRLLHAGAPFSSPSTLDRMLTPALDDYAYGLAVGAVPVGSDSVRAIRHSGGIFGFSTGLWYVPGDSLTIAVLDNATGNANRLAADLLQALYGQPVEPPRPLLADTLATTIEMRGVDAASALFNRLMRNPDDWDMDEQRMSVLARAYADRKEPKTALKLFEFNTLANPDSWRTWDDLGEAQLLAGDREHASQSYARAYERNPRSMSVSLALEQLGIALPVDSVRLSKEQLERYAGTYLIEGNADERMVLVLRDSRLKIDSGIDQDIALYALTDTRFRSWFFDASMDFEIDDRGRPTRLGYTLRDRPTIWYRRIE